MTRTGYGSMIEFTVSEHGGQLISLTKDGKEYICSGTPYWAYSAPVLFPIVGRLKNDSYRLGEKVYTLKQHGFARNRDFICTDDEPLTYRLAYDDDTLKSYPFKFVLTTSYRPINNELIITSRVQNPSEDDIWFSLGAHPALKVPFDGGRFEDYLLYFECEEHAKRIPLTKDGLLSRNRVDFLNGRTVQLNYDLFKDDALVFENLKSRRISIRHGNKAVTVRADNVPYWGIWTKPGAPFLCIEPWCGHADFEDFDGDFTQKPGILSLEAGKSFSMQYSILIDA